MTVVVNAVAAKMGGAATYIRELVRELARQPGTDRFVFYVPLEQAEAGRAVPAHIEWRVSRVGHAGALRRLWWDQVTLRRILRRERADVLYSTANFAMFRCPLPQLLLVRNSLYVSNLYRHLFLPRQSTRARLAFALRRWWLRRSLRHATHLLAPSQALRDELTHAWPGLTPHLSVNPYGVAAPAYPSPSRAAGAFFKMAYPSLYAEHKNLATVLRALRLLVESGDTDFQFWTTANPNWPPARITSTWQDDLVLAGHEALRERVRFVSPEGPDPLRQLYAGCSLVLYPTLVESFGHGLLETLQAGLPVLAADTPVNRELAGEAALYFEGLNSADLAEKIRLLWRDPGRRTAMANGGPTRARGFRWEAHVQRLRAIAARSCEQRSS
ncbi:MAG: glycosyltransferase [Terriglobia bacterium]